MTLKIITVLCVLFVSACASNQAPQISHDGLELVPDSKFGEVYMKPNASFSEYTEFGIDGACVISDILFHNLKGLGDITVVPGFYQ